MVGELPHSLDQGIAATVRWMRQAGEICRESAPRLGADGALNPGLTADLLVLGTAVGDEASIVALALIGIAASSANLATSTSASP